jgi:hypothetical protein
MKEKLILIVLIPAFVLTCSPVLAEEPKKMARTVDGLVIPAELISPLLGVKIERLCVMAGKNEKLSPVPFQVDEMTPDRSEYILPDGPEPNTDRSDGVLSPQDEIALMVKDLGGRVERESWPRGAKTVEVEVIDPLDGGRAWCYVSAVESPPALPDKDYVTWDPERGEVRTAMYLNGYPPGKNAVYFSRVTGVPPEGGTGEDFVDRMKLRFRFESIGGLISFSGNEDMAGQKVLREKDGPVRVFRQGMVYYELPFGMQYNAAGTLQIYWESFGHGPVELKVPRGVTAIVREAMMISTTDFAPAAKGMRFFSDKDREGVVIDGKMSAKERAMDVNGVRWTCVTGAPGTLCNRTPTNVPALPPEDNRLEWVDDVTRKDPPEDHPGMMGCMVNYFDLSALPPGRLWRSAALFYTPPPDITADDAQAYLNIESHPLVIEVDGRLGRSRILPWHPELPDDYYLNYRPLPGEIDLR